MVNDRRQSGTVIRILRDKAYGFIKVEGEKDVFFHASGLDNCTIDDLEEGMQVTFAVGQNRQGKKQAEELRVLKGSEVD